MWLIILLEINFPHKELITNTKNSRLHKAFANNSPANIKLSKLHKIKKSEKFLGRPLGPLSKAVFFFLFLIKNVVKP